MTESLVEKYRPKKLDEIVGQDKIIQSIKALIKRYGKKLPHMLFYGNAGTGKTTTAICIARELYGDSYKEYFVEFNASDERGIDVIREKIKRIAKMRGNKIIFLDEADALTPDAQHALRRIMETGEGTFILTCNKIWKIIPPIKSRCVIYHFKDLDTKTVVKRLLEICKKEGVEIKNEDKEKLLQSLAGLGTDLRQAINTLDRAIYEEDGIKKININLLAEQEITDFDNMLKLAIQGDFERAKSILEKQIFANADIDKLFDELYKAVNKIKKKELKTKLLYELAKVEYRVKHGSDLLIQLTAFLAVTYILPHLLDVASGEL